MNLKGFRNSKYNKFKYVIIGVITIAISLAVLYFICINSFKIYTSKELNTNIKDWLNFAATFSGGIIGAMFAMIGVLVTLHFTQRFELKKENDKIDGIKFILLCELSEYINSVDKAFYSIVKSYSNNQYILPEFDSVNRLYKLDDSFKGYVHSLISFGKIEEGKKILQFYDMYINSTDLLKNGQNKHMFFKAIIDFIGNDDYKKYSTFALFECRKNAKGEILQICTDPLVHREELDRFLINYENNKYKNFRFLNEDFKKIIEFLSNNE